MTDQRLTHDCSRQSASDVCIGCEMDTARHKAWKALAGYKFWMFGYWAAIWVHLNHVGRFKQPNPWKVLVDSARSALGETAES